MAKSIDLYVDQGSDFIAVLPPVTAPDGTVVNLTNYTVSSQIRRSFSSVNAVQLVTTVTSPITGVISLSLSHGETGGLTPTRYVYDVNITNTQTQFITKVFDGLFVVNPGVTGKPNTNLVVPYLPSDFGG